MTNLFRDPSVVRTVLALATGQHVELADRHRVQIAAAIALQAPEGFVFLDQGAGRFVVGPTDAPKGLRPARSDGIAALQALHGLVAAAGREVPWQAKTQGATFQRLRRAARAVGRASPELGAVLARSVHVAADGTMHFAQDDEALPLVIRAR